MITAFELAAIQSNRLTRWAGGSLELLAGNGSVIATVPLSSPSAGSSAGAVITFSGFPRTASPLVVGSAIASGRIKDSGGNIVDQGLTTGLAGSGAMIIVSKTTPVSGDQVRVDSLTHTAGAA